MVIIAVEDNPEKHVVLCEPLEPDEWNDFLMAVGEGLQTGEITEADAVQFIRAEREFL